MTEQEVIASQAIKICNLEEEVRERKEHMEKALMVLVCIGGPLNDNKLEYTTEQRAELHEIEKLLSE